MKDKTSEESVKEVIDQAVVDAQQFMNDCFACFDKEFDKLPKESTHEAFVRVSEYIWNRAKPLAVHPDTGTLSKDVQVRLYATALRLVVKRMDDISRSFDF